MPKTNAPVFAFVPTTSEMKFMPVDRTIVWEIPTNIAIMYMTQPVLSVKNNMLPKLTTHIIVPTLKAALRPNLV